MVTAFIFMQMVHERTYPLDPQCLECWLHSMSDVKNWKSFSSFSSAKLRENSGPPHWVPVHGRTNTVTLCLLQRILVSDLRVWQFWASDHKACEVIALPRTILFFYYKETILHAFISSCLGCCNRLFTCLKKSLHRLQSVQDSAARLFSLKLEDWIVWF